VGTVMNFLFQAGRVISWPAQSARRLFIALPS
jgi:hypothetical protein